MNHHDLIHKRENVLFVTAIIISILIIIALAVSVIGILILAGLAVLTMLSHSIAMTHIRMNGIELNEQQFPSLFIKTKVIADKMGIYKLPEVYILQSGGILNAFASRVFGMFGKDMVVLYSDIVELSENGSEDEIEFIIAHEIAHIKRNHSVKNMFIFPAMWIPFLGEAYSRACEITCDRMAAFYTGKPEAGINAMMVLAAGKQLYRGINKREYLEQLNRKRGLMVVLTELLSTHPPLPKRIHFIEDFAGGGTTIELVPQKKTVFVTVLASIVLGLGIFTWSLYALSSEVMSQLALVDYDSYEYWGEEELTPLMDAALMNDAAEVEALLNEGADPNEQEESFGETALHFAVSNLSYESVELLINSGADVNSRTYYDATPLMNAILTDDAEIVSYLLEAGADPALKDEDNWTALDYAEMMENQEIISLIKE